MEEKLFVQYHAQCAVNGTLDVSLVPEIFKGIPIVHESIVVKCAPTSIIYDNPPPSQEVWVLRFDTERIPSYSAVEKGMLRLLQASGLTTFNLSGGIYRHSASGGSLVAGGSSKHKQPGSPINYEALIKTI